LKKRFTFFKEYAGLALISLLSILPSPACKKNPITPDTAELTRPIIWLDTSEATFVAYEAGGNPSPQSFKVKNAGKSKLDYTLTDDHDWLSVEPANGSSSGQVVEHTIFIDKSGLSAQEAAYSAIVTINCPEAYNNPQTISVNLNISQEPPPQIWVNPGEMTFAATVGTNPSTQTLKIKNSGQGTLNYTVTWDAQWLNVSPASGSSGGEEKSHTVSVSSAALAEGTFSGMITIADSHATNNPQTVKVTLNVSKTPPPVIGLSTTQLSFAATVGQNPSPGSLGVRNSGGGTLSYQITWDAGWMGVNPASGSSTGQENSHTVTVNSASLGAGSYNGTITVTSPGATNTPQQVSVTLDVTSTPTDNEIYITCNPSSGGTGTTVTIPVSIKGNTKDIATFGLDLTFDSGLFDSSPQSITITKGSLNGNWATVDGNVTSPGTVRIGGFAGSGSAIPAGSVGSIAVVTLKVIGTAYSNGHQSQVTIKSYTDDIAGMKTDPTSAIFTFTK
jgi:hypothetical protein